MKTEHGVNIREAYKNYTPPVNIVKAIDRFIRNTPKKYLVGMNTVVLTNSLNLPKKEREANVRRDGKSFKAGAVRGEYYQPWKGKPAWIKLFVDNIFCYNGDWFMRIPLIRDFMLGDTFFHELGHHIHRTQQQRKKTPEGNAEYWKARLLAQYIIKVHWYLYPVVGIMWLVKRLKKILKK